MDFNIANFVRILDSKYVKSQNNNSNLETWLILRKRNSLIKARGNCYNSDHATNAIRQGFLRAPSLERVFVRDVANNKCAEQLLENYNRVKGNSLTKFRR